jgi:hypothetical protein
MASFEATFTDGATIAPWNDPASGGVPTRLNAFGEHPHLRFTAVAGVEVEVSASIAGVVGPLDATLGGLLFAMTFAEIPVALPPAITSPAGQSSVQRFTPPEAGHYTVKLKRPQNGSVFLHIDAL